VEKRQSSTNAYLKKYLKMPHTLEQNQPYSTSKIWSLQRAYFEQMGFEAWRQGEVPHYVTTNPRIANSYAEIIFALYNDLGPHEQPLHEPFYIVEIGAGSGRFAYYLLKRLIWLCDQANIHPSAFRYVVTDFTQSNADFWREHPCMIPFIEKGLLDIGIIDLTKQEDIVLQVSGQIISTNLLEWPLTIVANYLFDSIPQELFFCKDRQAVPCLVSLSSEEEISSMKPAQQLEKLLVEYGYGQVITPHYAEPYLENLLEKYRNGCDDAYILFPDSAIRGMKYLASFSKKGLMLLTADKGEHIPSHVLHSEPPVIVRHGSFSLSVNYHALSLYCGMEGGVALFPEHKHGSINTGCLLFMENAASLRSVHIAYGKYVAEAGPDDYFLLFNLLMDEAEKMPLSTVLSALRVSLYDSHQLNRYLPRLTALADDMKTMDKIDVVNVLNICWDNYYPLGEYSDLANRIAMLLYKMDIYDWAIYYFNISMNIYGDDIGTLFNMAACYYQMGDEKNCMLLLRKVLEHAPDNTGALELLNRVEEVALVKQSTVISSRQE
jgi:hypothetical protein